VSEARTSSEYVELLFSDTQPNRAQQSRLGETLSAYHHCRDGQRSLSVMEDWLWVRQHECIMRSKVRRI